MADDPLLDNKIETIDKEQIPTRGVVQAVLDTVIPCINEAIRGVKHLHERLLRIEAEVVDGDARSAADNPILAVPPLTEALTENTVERLAASDLAIATGVDLCEASDEDLLAVEGIGDAKLKAIREHYPKIE